LKEKRVIILLGPTGVGKTGVSMLIAASLETEIISADSMQVYRGMDIGTAKPKPVERSLIKHHLIDIVNPSDTYSVGRYINDVRPVIDTLHSKNKIPVVVGGTGLYIRALTKGLFTAPEADPDLRTTLLEMEKRSPGSLFLTLKKVDPEKAESISPSDKRRLIRALEVSIRTRRPISELQRELTSPLPYEYIKIGLKRERDELYRLIDERVDDMFSNGLIEEVKRLLEKDPSDTPLQAIGYKEVLYYLRGEKDIDETKNLIKRSTRRYAKRQFTWFKKEESVQWVDITAIFRPDEIFRKLLRETSLKDLIS
jgi:tRNA dimethylallyltransferase